MLRAMVMILAMLLAASGTAAQLPTAIRRGASPEFRAGGGGPVPVSPSVVATDNFTIDDSRRAHLEVLVLWRGTPGWFLKGEAGGSSSGWRGGAVAGGQGITTSEFSQGGVQFSMKFDPQQRMAWINGTPVSMQDANVILVDSVDSAIGPQVVRTLWIDPLVEATPIDSRGGAAQPFGAVRVQDWIRRSPDAVAYLQCDLQLNDPRASVQQKMATVCAMVQDR